jgi:hypothetical protein
MLGESISHRRGFGAIGKSSLDSISFRLPLFDQPVRFDRSFALDCHVRFLRRPRRQRVREERFSQNDRRSELTARRIISVVLTGTMVVGTAFQSGSMPAMAQTAANANDQALDKLMGPIALYPDPLLAQVLACASSPQQVTDVDAWLKMQDKELQGSKLQEAATAKGFDASFAAIVLFPDVLDTLAKNIPWTTEVGKAFVSDQKAVLDSVQRLRKQAQTVGNLKTTPQQEVKVETQDGQQVIVVQPANPQIVYVPVYNTTTVYTTPPPPPAKEKDDSDVAVAAILGFMAGIAIGVAASDPYPYGWGAWGVGWHSHSVVVVGGAWHVPPGGRYGYARPVPYGSYRAPTNINAPTRNVNNVNINVDNSRTNNNVNNSRNNSATARPSTQPATRPSTQQPAARPSTQPSTQPAARPSTQPSTTQNRAGASATATPSTRGYSSPSASPSARTGTSSSGLSGYQNRSSAGAASSRGARSAGGGRRR